MTNRAVGDKVYFWPSQDPYHEATIVEVADDMFGVRYRLEYLGLLGEVTHQWVSARSVY